MKKSPTITTDPNILAIVHRTGRMWRGLIASTKSGQPAVIGTRDFPPGQESRMEDWLADQHAGTVLCVIPAGAVICRNCVLPNAAPDQLQQALQLQAEAHLLGVAPPHRLAMAVLSESPGETTRTGLVLAWPESATFALPPISRSMQFIPDVAAMAALLNGHRPTEVPLWLDREDGSVALAISHSGGLALRTTREESSTSEQWQTSIGRIAAETALGAGHTGPFIETIVLAARANAAQVKPNEARLFLPEELIPLCTSRAQGLSKDAAWWSQYGILAGALLARTGPLASLSRLLKTPKIETPTPMRALAQQFSRPSAAAVAVLSCVLIVMFGPLIFTGLKLAVLNLRFGDVQTQLASATQAKHQVAVYRELGNQNTWSMTKLLADIAGYTPIGIELETVRIDGGKEFGIGGTAISTDGRTPAQLVALMQENLRKHGLFTDINVSAGKSDNLGRYRFDLSAKVAKPYTKPVLPEELDFAILPYKVRLYGEEARDKPATTTSTTAVASASAPMDDGEIPSNVLAAADQPSTDEVAPIEDVPLDVESHEARIQSNARVGMPSGANFADDRGSGSSAADPRAVPPPLDEEQVKIMSRAELKDALAKIAKARLNRDLDKDTQSRLKQEQDLVMDYLRKAPAS